jgi:hypothetical protein
MASRGILPARRLLPLPSWARLCDSFRVAVGIGLVWALPGRYLQAQTVGASTQSLVCVDTMLALKGLPAPATAERVQAGGYYTLGDKAPVCYRWSPTSAAADDGGAVINPAKHTGNGRWLLMWDGHTAYAADWGLRGSGADDTAPLQAAVNAVDNNGYGVVVLPNGGYRITGIVLGISNGSPGKESRSSCISLHGGSNVCSQLLYTGPSDGVAIKCNKNAFAHFADFRLTNKGAKGTTDGIQMTGPSFGNDSQNDTFEKVLIEGFHNGWHLSGNAPGRLSGNSCSECSMRDATITRCDNGILQDDFNSLNQVIENVDFQFNAVGIAAMLPGINVLSGSGEYDGIDIAYFNPTNNTGVVSAANWRSENGTTFLYANGPVVLSNILVVNLNTSNPLAPAALGDIKVPGVAPAFPSIAFGHFARSVSVRNSDFYQPIFVEGPMDVTVENCLVVGKDVVVPRADAPSGNGARYEIASCSVCTDLQTNIVKYANRRGNVLGTAMVDSVGEASVRAK